MSKIFPKTLNIKKIVLDSLSPSDRADALIFKSMLKNPYTNFGEADDNNFYGSPRSYISHEDSAFLNSLGLSTRGGFFSHVVYSVQSLLDKNYTLEFVVGSFKNEKTYHFMGTNTMSREEATHITANAVIVSPEGEKLKEISITTIDSFNNLLLDALKEGDQVEAARAIEFFLTSGKISIEVRD